MKEDQLLYKTFLFSDYSFHILFPHPLKEPAMNIYKVTILPPLKSTFKTSLLYDVEGGLITC